MACLDPIPVIQGDGSTFQWSNCNCAAAAQSLDADTCGTYKTNGARVRYLTNDRSGGTTLNQVDTALRVGWPQKDHLDVRLGLAFPDAITKVSNGYPCILQGKYNFATIGLSGSPGFYGNHSVFWYKVTIYRRSDGTIDYTRSRGLIFDPLWDGRRDGIPSRVYRWISLAVLRQFAGTLIVDPATDRRAGIGYCYAAFTGKRPTPIAPKPPALVINYGSNTMIVGGGLTITSSHVMALKQGQPLYRSPKSGSSVVTKMSRDAKVDYIGNAAPGWRAVRVTTKNFPDGLSRPVIVYVQATAGTVSSK